MYACAKEIEGEKKMFNLCIVLVCWDEFEQAGEFFGMHMGGWRGGGGGEGGALV